MDKNFELTDEAVLRELGSVAFAPAGDETGSELKYSNKLKALELLCKHLGLLADKRAAERGGESAGEGGVVVLPPVEE